MTSTWRESGIHDTLSIVSSLAVASPKRFPELSTIMEGVPDMRLTISAIDPSGDQRMLSWFGGSQPVSNNNARDVVTSVATPHTDLL